MWFMTVLQWLSSMRDITIVAITTDLPVPAPGTPQYRERDIMHRQSA
jgi:hypothetical protein